MEHDTLFSRASLTDTFQANAKNGPFQDFMTRLAAARFEDMSVEDRCKTYQHLKNNVIETARQTGLYRKAADGGMGEVLEEHFLKEIALMLLLAQTLEFSPRLDHWLEERTMATAKAFHGRDPLPRLEKWWPGFNLAERFGTAIDFVETQMKAFEPGAISFLKPKVRPLANNGAVAGSLVPQSLRLDTTEPPYVTLTAAMVEKGSIEFVLKTAFHETVHQAIWQLGAAHHRGMMPKDHPLYEDAVLSRARIQFRAHGPSSIPTAYNTDPEEVRCYKFEDLFWQEYERLGAQKPPPLPRRLLDWALNR